MSVPAFGMSGEPLSSEVARGELDCDGKVKTVTPPGMSEPDTVCTERITSRHAYEG